MDNNIYDIILGQIANDVALQARAANSAFITNMAGVNSVHARCAQVIDKRIAEYDIEEVRAASSIDPSTQSWWLSKANGDNGASQTSTGQLLEILRQMQRTGTK
jgi:hypothetical protein